SATAQPMCPARRACAPHRAGARGRLQDPHRPRPGEHGRPPQPWVLTRTWPGRRRRSVGAVVDGGAGAAGAVAGGVVGDGGVAEDIELVAGRDTADGGGAVFGDLGLVELDVAVVGVARVGEVVDSAALRGGAGGLIAGDADVVEDKRVLVVDS